MGRYDTASAALRARQALSELFFEILVGESPATMASFEDEALLLGHAAMADAMTSALECYDALLCSKLPVDVRIHDKRCRTLATKLGDVSFRWTRVRDVRGCTETPLADALDLPFGCRISPSASSFLVAAGAEVSYSKAARLLERAGGSLVSAAAVMFAMRDAGGLCAEDDAALAESLYSDGVLPCGSNETETLCLEADGTWFSVQKPAPGTPKRLEVKAVVAYADKEVVGGKVRRIRPVRHAMVGIPSKFMPEAIAAIGTRYDLSKVRRVHVGADGEGWCLSAGEWLPKAEACVHLDPFHINRAVLSCFADSKMGWHVLDALWDGGKEQAANLIEAAAALGEARPKRAAQVVGYLRHNMEFIDVSGPTLGTMESENQHLYGVRMDSFPCAWSPRGASDMARIRSRVHSGREVPRMTREKSASPRRRARRERRELEFLAHSGQTASQVVQSVGKGWEPPQASVAGLSAEVRFAAGVDKGMVAING